MTSSQSRVRAAHRPSNRIREVKTPKDLTRWHDPVAIWIDATVSGERGWAWRTYGITEERLRII